MTRIVALTHYSILALDGDDALTFAQNQFANDVRALAVGDWQWNSYLNAQGRAIALFVLLRTGARTLWAVQAYAEATSLRARLSKYVFRSKVALTVSAWHAAGERLGFTQPLAAGGQAQAHQGASRIDLGGQGGRVLWLTEAPSGATDADGARAWHADDIADALTWIDPTLTERFVAHALHWDRLPAMSVKKGCYPGQEIVARTHFLGRNKRRLVRLDAPHAARLAVGTALLDPERRESTLGTVLLAVDRGERTLALAVVGEHGQVALSEAAPEHEPLVFTDA
jgi:hypothetical protein